MQIYYDGSAGVFATFDTVKIPNHTFFLAYPRLHRLCLIIGLALMATMAHAQLNFEFTEGKYMIKGQVADLKTSGSVPFANVWITNQKKGVTSDQDGKFTMYIYPTDTLRFSALGYIPKTIPVSAISERDKYTFTIQLVEDIYSLKQVTIYPFHNKEEFADQFIKGTGMGKPVTIAGIDAPKYIHKEKAKFYNPISAIYNNIKKNRSAADPNFKP